MIPFLEKGPSSGFKPITDSRSNREVRRQNLLVRYELAIQKVGYGGFELLAARESVPVCQCVGVDLDLN